MSIEVSVCLTVFYYMGGGEGSRLLSYQELYLLVHFEGRERGGRVNGLPVPSVFKFVSSSGLSFNKEKKDQLSVYETHSLLTPNVKSHHQLHLKFVEIKHRVSRKERRTTDVVCQAEKISCAHQHKFMKREKKRSKDSAGHQGRINE